MDGDETALVKAPVLIVGAGPAGLAAGLLLRQYGVETLTVSRYNWTAHTPRAHHINPRAMEMLRRLGLERAIRQTATPHEAINHIVWCTTLAGEEIGRLRTYHQEGTSGVLDLTPCHAVNIPQHRLEPILMEALLSRGGKTLLNTECLEVRQRDDKVLVQVRNCVTEQRYWIEAEYVIGADGARSAVAQQIGLEFEGEAGWSHAISVWIKADLARFCAHRPGLMFFTNQVDGEFWIGSGAFLNISLWDEWVVAFMFDPAAESPDLSPATIKQRIHEVIGDDSVEIEILHTGTWQMNAQYARSYSRGRVFCMGDAVHRHSPANGLGANMSMLDANNLAWKLKLVLSGVATPALLDTYNEERQPVGRRIIERSMQSVGEMTEIPAALGYRPGQTRNEREANWEAFLAPGETNSAMRDAVAEAVDRARFQFNALGFELGQRYTQGAVLPHQDQCAPNPDPDLTYLPQTAAGCSLPHAYLTHHGRESVSTLDIVAGGAFHLLTGIGGEAWADVAAEIGRRTGLEIQVVVIGPGREYQDAYGEWRRVRGVADDGCLLVRPDAHIAWRAQHLDALAVQALQDGIKGLLGWTDTTRMDETASKPTGRASAVEAV